MMRCPEFRYFAPSTIAEAASILAEEGPQASLLGGGTDLVPNMKRRQQTPAALIATRRIAELHQVDAGAAAARIGAGITLSAIAESRPLRAWSALARAAAQVATPHIRNSGTLGGNLCVDTRCNYYDQSYEWRKAIDFCMKKDGGVCWVAPGSPRCWAVSSTDCAPALIALDAQVELVSKAQTRIIPVSQLYKDDGIDYLARRPDEVLASVRLGDPAGWRSTYWKLRRREAFDFPVLSVAAAVKLDGDRVVDARIVFGAVASHPVSVDASLLIGTTLDDASIERVADAASRFAKPLDNTDFTLGWRKRVARAYVTGALKELRGDDLQALGLLARRQSMLRVLP
jgi:4-hydroxybenzoyl-CoA reductase subunit beta